MKRTLLALTTVAYLACFSSIASSQDAAAANEAALKRLSDMRSFLSTASLSTYLDKSAENGWRIPTIRSSWYVQRIPVDRTQRHALEQARRDFGFQLAEKLTPVAKVVRLPGTNQKTLEETVRTLLDLRDSLISEPGYGNLLLTRRAVDIAAIAATRLVADLHYPDNKVEVLVSQFADSWNSADIRRRVLNDEVGKEVFGRSALFGGEESLKKTWAANVGKALQIRGNESVGEVVPEIAIFADDEISDLSAPTTEELWNRKVHFLLVQGLDTGSVTGLRSLLVFRKKVGKFPVQGGVKVFKEDSEVAAAFEKAWRPYQYERQDQKWRLLHANASSVFEKVVAGTLCDEDELQRRNSTSK